MQIVSSNDLDALNFYGGNKEAFMSKDSYVVLVGAAATGKTYSMCWKMHLFALKYPGVRILLTRKSLRSLRDSAVKTYQKVIEQHGMDNQIRTLGETRPTEFIYPHLKTKHGNKVYEGQSRIILAPLDKNGKALGAEYDMVYVNQPDTEGTSLEEFKLIRSRCRLDNAPYRQLICDPNPSFDKHWLLTEALSEDNPKGNWKLINSTHKDNPYLYDHSLQEWTEVGMEQMKILEDLPGHLKANLFEGRWHSGEGMAFSGYWSDARHMLYLHDKEAYDDLKISTNFVDDIYENTVPQEWDHYLSIDWGMSPDPFVALLIAHHPKKDIFIVHKHIYITNKDIFYVSELTRRMIDGYNIKEVIADRGPAERAVMEKTLNREITGAIKYNNSNNDAMNICIAQLNAGKWKFVHNDYSLFHDPDPELLKKRRPMGAEEIPNLRKDPKSGLIAKNQPDHYYDAWKYFCRYWIDKTQGYSKTQKFIWI